MRKSAESLLSVINDILDFSKIEAGGLVIECNNFDLRQVIEEVAEMLETKAETNGIELIVQYAPNMPRYFSGDAGRIRQVITNLVANGVKFTNQGYVLVSVQCEDANLNHAMMKITVADTGIGICAGQAGDPVRQIHPGRYFHHAPVRRDRAGADHLQAAVELMGGSIQVESSLGKGSQFLCRLPLEVDFAPPEQALPPADLSGLRVLIVDDNEVNRRVVHEQIVSWGMRNGSFETALHALQAVRAAKAEGDPYHFVIADFQMPGMDGASLAAEIKKDPSIADTVVVMLTSIGDWRQAKGLEGDAVDACLVKPVRHSQLFNMLATAWARRLQAAKAHPHGLFDAKMAVRPAFVRPVPGKSFARSGGGRQRGESEGGPADAGADGDARGRGGQRARGGGNDPHDSVRPDFHGLPDAGDERLRGNGDHSGARETQRDAPADHCADGARDEGRPREVSCGWNGRLLTKPIQPGELDEVLVRYAGQVHARA